VVSGKAPDHKGNNALDQIFGAEITYVPQKDFDNYLDIMEDLKADYASKGQKARLIPVGASTPLGTLGYVSAFEEILDQEKAMGIEFDTICTAVGSAGTYAGLWLGNEFHGAKKQIFGMNIYSREVDYDTLVEQLSSGAADILGASVPPSARVLIEDYVHTGYGELSDENAAYLQAFAKDKGIILDPVYTGKAFYGLIQEIIKENPHIFGKVLFIHTGGIFGALARKEVYL
jgi:D-cysteine desulfhydrase